MRIPIYGDVPRNFPISQAAEKKSTAHAAACDRFNEDLATWQRETDQLRNVPESGWSIEHDDAATRLRSTERQLAVREIQLRESLDELLIHVRDVEQPAAREGAHQAYLKSKQDIDKRLRKIGYVDHLPSGHPSLTENMVERHPDVSAAWQVYRSYSDFDNRPNQQANAKELHECRAALANYKQRAMAGLAV